MVEYVQKNKKKKESLKKTCNNNERVCHKCGNKKDLKEFKDENVMCNDCLKVEYSSYKTRKVERIEIEKKDKTKKIRK